MSFISDSIVRQIFSLLCLASFYLCSPVQACWDVIPLDLNTTTQLGGMGAGQSLSFDLEVPSKGILTVLATGSLGSAAPALDRTSGCERDRSGGARVLSRSLRRISLAVRAGTHSFKVASQDLRSPLPRVDIRTIFTASIEGEEDPGEVDVDPDPFHLPGTSRRQLPGTCQSIEGEEDPGEVDVDPDPFHLPGTSRRQLPGTCQSIEGEEDPGEVDVDPDPFHQEESDPTTGRKLVLPHTASSGLWVLSADTAGRAVGLYDDRGQRLAVSESGFQRLLLPGTYFLQLEEAWNSKSSQPATLRARPW